MSFDMPCHLSAPLRAQSICKYHSTAFPTVAIHRLRCLRIRRVRWIRKLRFWRFRMNKQQKGNQMKRQHTCAVALMLGCVFATPSNARPDPQATIGPVTQFCGERVCPTYLSTTPRVVERRTVRRHHRVARPVLPKARPLDANGNPGDGLVTVATAAGIDITVSKKMAPKMQAFIADLMEIGYKPKQIHCSRAPRSRSRLATLQRQRL